MVVFPSDTTIVRLIVKTTAPLRVWYGRISFGALIVTSVFDINIGQFKSKMINVKHFNNYYYSLFTNNNNNT